MDRDDIVGLISIIGAALVLGIAVGIVLYKIR